MSNRKNYNSIVFLTTLGVYLGLVLAGGVTPTVLAQAALTRDFDIRSEVVLEDDLDKKPDDAEKIDFADSLQDYLDEIESFVIHLQKLHKKEVFNLDRDSFGFSREINTACNVDGDPVTRSVLSKNISSRLLDPEITDAIAIIHDWKILSDCLKNEQGTFNFSTNSKLKLSYDNAELKIELSAPKLTRQRADFLANGFNQASGIYKTDEEKSIVKKIHETTSFKSENNQVFIVTRLPRASIDDLLAGK